MHLPIARKHKERGLMNPIQQRLSLLDNLEKNLFDTDFWRPFDLLGDEMEQTLQYWTPKVDITETDTEMTITANIPGVKPDDVKVELDDHSLIISGKVEEKKEEKGKTWYRVERESGELYRRFQLPENVNTENINARVQNGILTVVLQKKPSAARKKIEVQKE